MNIIFSGLHKILKEISWPIVGRSAFVLAAILLCWDRLSDWAGLSIYRQYRVELLWLLILGGTVIVRDVWRGLRWIYRKMTFTRRMIARLDEDSKLAIRTRFECDYATLSKESPALRFLAQNGYIRIGHWTDGSGNFRYNLCPWLISVGFLDQQLARYTGLISEDCARVGRLDLEKLFHIGRYIVS